MDGISATSELLNNIYIITWQNWTTGILGLAVIWVAFMGLTGTALLWTLAIAGIVIAIIGFWGGAMANASSMSAMNTKRA